MRNAVIWLALLAWGTVSVDAQRDKHVVGINAEPEDGEQPRNSEHYVAQDLEDDMVDWDKQSVDQQSHADVTSNLTPGDEFTQDKHAQFTSEELAHQANELYEKALRFMERGKGHGEEGKRAAYRLIDEAHKLGHNDAKKLTAFAHLFGDRARWSIEEARKLLFELEEIGSPDAQLALGFMHATGIGFSQSNQAKALVYYMFSALGGNPLAQMAMGYRYHSGVGVPQNCETSLSYYQQVAKKVAESVKFSTGLAVQRIRLTDENEPTLQSTSSPINPDLLEYYRYLADKGDLSAQFGLGQIYLSGGRGVEQNFELARKYFSTAAEAGHGGAFALLGKMYLDGTSVTPQDNHTAMQFFIKSAEKGNPSGQAGLGIMYYQGRSVSKDYEKAYRYFTHAAEQGWVDGQLYLGEMLYKGFPTKSGIRRDFKGAVKQFQLAAQNGHVLAYYNLGQMHATGTGVTRSCNNAVELFKNVAERGRWSEKLMEAYNAYKNDHRDAAAMKYLFMGELGYEAAQTNVAYILDKGEADSLFPESRENILERAIVHWQRAANQEYPLARIKLGDYHYYGWGTKTDYKQAAQNYKLAADRHAAAQAMFNLGFMHEQGLGITKDLHLAKRFYDMAAEHSTDAIVPVTLALSKLALIFLVEQLNTNPVIAYAEKMIGPYWDIVAIAVLLIIPTLYFMQRHLGRRNEIE
ncbi:hypothetical protein WR25_02921 [Diploscapter pachys]|uniref:DOD-type homing endonuclease domain-containing protein n=1 Tax=Diploscapter pachys TaxID=2018661 RepID=A0A2A2JG29_9BILA|nr:hypothetical protein WR25_02921 [Diploscapter pachys]